MSDIGGDNRFPTPPPPPPNMAPPPGYVPYGGTHQGAFGSYRRIGGLARSISALLVILIPIQIVSTIVLVGIRDKAKDFLNDEITRSEFEDSAALSGLIGFASGAIFVALVVLTMVWMFRLAKNLQSIDRVGTWTPGWAIAGWFLPPCGIYFIPYLMFRDLWKGSDPEPSNDWRTNNIAGIVHVWWILYGLAPLAFLGVTLRSVNFSRDIDDVAKQIDDTFTLQALSGVVQILAAVAYLLLVRGLSDRHRQLIGE